MEPTARPRIKVCCIANGDELRLTVRLGASAVGLVADMPSGPGPIPEPLIAELAAAAPPGVATFLLTSLQTAPAIAEQARRCRVGTVQICDRLTDHGYHELRAALPALKVVQVVHVTGPEAVAEAVEVAPFVDGILLDSGNPGLAVKELGGTGRRHDWQVSRRVREAVPVPVFLAGGLTPQNAAEAVTTIGPFGLDVCTGVRTGGALDAGKLGAFLRAAGAGP